LTDIFDISSHGRQLIGDTLIFYNHGFLIRNKFAFFFQVCQSVIYYHAILSRNAEIIFINKVSYGHSLLNLY